MAAEPGTDEADTGPLEHSRKLVDEGHEAAHAALEDDPLDGDMRVPGVGIDAEGAHEEVTPRPN